MRVEVRNDSVKIEGYVNAVGRDSRVMTDVRGGKFVEQVCPGAFQRAINSAGDIEIRANHEYEVGSLKQGNLSLKEDNIGLFAKADITDEAVVAAARAGNLRGWSFGFRAKKDRFEPTNEDGLERRFLDEIDLLEVSILTNKTPAYYGTSIEARDEEDETREIRCLLADDIEVIKDNDVNNANKHADDEQRAIFYSQLETELEILRLRRG